MIFPARRALPTGITLMIGLGLGVTLATIRPAGLQALPSVEEVSMDQTAVGPVSIEQNQDSKMQIPKDAIYYLDYRAGRLIAWVPSAVSTVGGTKMLNGYADRDLVQDFKLAPGSQAPRFRMVTGTSGILNGDWAALYVFEGSSRQVATYRVMPQSVGISTRPKFELLQIESFASPGQPRPASGR